MRIWRNEVARDWSIEINGRLSEQVSFETGTDRVERSLILAENSLTEAAIRHPQ